MEIDYDINFKQLEFHKRLQLVHLNNSNVCLKKKNPAYFITKTEHFMPKIFCSLFKHPTFLQIKSKVENNQVSTGYR